MGHIVVENLGKAYKVYPSKLERLKEWLIPFGNSRHQDHWVLRDISFNVKSGEAVGIIGINGAGKSTLLKMITGTNLPTSGKIEINGKVAALLELGMGFHPDFTGRQNIIMAGQLLGYSKVEMEALIPEIEVFAGIDDYIDQPVRVYSSGMQMRLAFSVATASRPDILIVDEAFSVGDAAFQRKCFQRIESFRSAGTTLLLVSHDIETIKKLCDKALFIKDGRLGQMGPAKQVCDEYERYLFGSTKSVQTNTNTSVDKHKVHASFDPSLTVNCEMVYGNDRAKIEDCWLADELGNRINVIESGTKFLWCYRVYFENEVKSPIFAMMIKTREGVGLYGVDSKKILNATNTYQAGESVEVSFALENYLAPGTYYFNCGVRQDGHEGIEFLSRRVDAGILRVVASEDSSVLSGLVEMQAKISSKLLSSDRT